MRVIHLVTDSMSLALLRGQLKHLQAKGFDVHVVSAPGAAQERFRADEGVPVHSIGFRREVSPLHDLIALIQLWSLFRRLKPTVVHSGTPKAGFLGTLAAASVRVPYRIESSPFLVETLHGS